MPSVIVVGGGLAGLSSAVALGSAGFQVTVFESRNFLGGRAASYPVPGASSEPELAEPEVIDNCQHILLRCCTNLLDFYKRLGVASLIRFYGTFYFIEPGGRVSQLHGSPLPPPLHFAPSFMRLPFLSIGDKAAIARGLKALRRESATRGDLERITMLDWLREKRQTPRATQRAWRQILVSAVNEELDVMAARHGFQVILQGFLGVRNGYEMGVPAVSLGELYSSEAWAGMQQVTFEMRSPVERVIFSENRATCVQSSGQIHQADYYISCLPFERVPSIAPELQLPVSDWGHSPITGIHLWFDRPVTDLPHATLLDATIQWFFNKREGRYLQLVVSASRSLLEMDRQEVISLALKELQQFLPRLGQAKLEKAHVVKEVRATFSATPSIETRRPGPMTRFQNFFLAGNGTAPSGRQPWKERSSGFMASEAVAFHAGRPQKFLLA